MRLCLLSPKISCQTQFHFSSLMLTCCQQAFQEEFEGRRSTLNTLQQTANPEDPTVLEQLNILTNLWTRVEKLTNTRELQLKDNLKSVSNLMDQISNLVATFVD